MLKFYPSTADNPDVVTSVDQANFDRVVGLIGDAVQKGVTAIAIAPRRIL